MGEPEPPPASDIEPPPQMPSQQPVKDDKQASASKNRKDVLDDLFSGIQTEKKLTLVGADDKALKDRRQAQPAPPAPPRPETRPETPPPAPQPAPPPQPIPAPPPPVGKQGPEKKDAFLDDLFADVGTGAGRPKPPAQAPPAPPAMDEPPPAEPEPAPAPPPAVPPSMLDDLFSPLQNDRSNQQTPEPPLPEEAAVPPNLVDVECYNCGNTITMNLAKRPVIMKCDKCGAEGVIE